jgi:uncharacterized protein (TIGR02588 family)
MKAETRKVPVWEWCVAAVGLVLILFVLGALFWDAFSESPTQPGIELRVKERLRHGPGELVVVEVHNRGGKVASNLKIRGTVESGDKMVEAGEVTIDYVPRRSRRTVGLFFAEPIGTNDLRLEPVGFVEP